jgi:quinohemoprotein ethanol dehydrogenase
MEAAARTWTGEWWKSGGGGAVWNAMAYDPEFHRVYVGTGNTAAPVGGEQIYTCSVVALDADSGEYAWHYRTPPADGQDCDSSTDITLATLTIDGAARKVILHAPKNGLFTVIDRAEGKAVSSAKLGGARALYPQSFSPRTGLAYVPAGMPASTAAAAPVDEGHSFLIAWDPVKQRANWQQPTPGSFNGGTVATAGDLVFQGQADGYVMGYDAGSGRRLWQFYAATAALGTPITYLAGGKQHLTILAGPMSGAAAGAGPAAARFGWDPRLHPRRVLTFVLDGKAKLPPTPPPPVTTPLDGTNMDVDPALADEGARMWSGCGRCHGPGAIAGGAAPDLRASQIPLSAATFATAVRTGNEPRGMPKFDELTDRELEALRHYVRARARLVTRPNGVAPPPPAAPAPAKDQKTDDEPERPPGSLESTTPRQ